VCSLCWYKQMQALLNLEIAEQNHIRALLQWGAISAFIW
jgi:hypothetical protein